MKRYHPVIAIILGNFVIVVLVQILYLPIPSFLLNILALFIIIIGGFTATYISRTNNAIVGLYTGLVYAIGSLIPFFIEKITLTFYPAIILVSFLILGFIGGYIGKLLRLRLENENNQGSHK
jgi:flagellar biosynthesis protein FliQ